MLRPVTEELILSRESFCASRQYFLWSKKKKSLFVPQCSHVLLRKQRGSLPLWFGNYFLRERFLGTAHGRLKAEQFFIKRRCISPRISRKFSLRLKFGSSHRSKLPTIYEKTTLCSKISSKIAGIFLKYKTSSNKLGLQKTSQTYYRGTTSFNKRKNLRAFCRKEDSSRFSNSYVKKFLRKIKIISRKNIFSQQTGAQVLRS